MCVFFVCGNFIPSFLCVICFVPYDGTLTLIFGRVYVFNWKATIPVHVRSENSFKKSGKLSFMHEEITLFCVAE